MNTEKFEVRINYGTHSELHGDNLDFADAINLMHDWERDNDRPQDQEFPFAYVQAMKEEPVAA